MIYPNKISPHPEKLMHPDEGFILAYFHLPSPIERV